MASVLPVRVVETAPVAEPLTLAQAKLRAGLDWPADDPRDAQMQGFISAARRYVEQRIWRAIPAQVHQLFYDSASVGSSLVIPATSQPSTVATVHSIDAADVEHVLDPSAYTVTRSAVQLLGPLPTDVRALEGWRVDTTCGSDVAALDPALVNVIGLLTAHYATLGRDLALSGHMIAEVPMGFEDALQPFVPEVLT